MISCLLREVVLYSFLRGSVLSEIKTNTKKPYTMSTVPSLVPTSSSLCRVSTHSKEQEQGPPNGPCLTSNRTLKSFKEFRPRNPCVLCLVYSTTILLKDYI